MVRVMFMMISLSQMIPRRTVSLFSFVLSSKPAIVMRTMCPGNRTHSSTKHVPFRAQMCRLMFATAMRIICPPLPPLVPTQLGNFQHTQAHLHAGLEEEEEEKAVGEERERGSGVRGDPEGLLKSCTTALLRCSGVRNASQRSSRT